MILSDLLMTGVSTILDKFKVDATKKAEMANELQLLGIEVEREAAKQAHDLIAYQAQANIEEAKNPSVFVSGWRPAAGWVCVTGFGLAYLLHPLVVIGVALTGYDVVIPNIDTSQLIPLLVSLLGLGAYRTYEKQAGVHAK